VCPLHGYTFDLASGKPAHNECRAIRTYPVRLTDQDEILVTLRRSRVAEATETIEAAEAIAGHENVDEAASVDA
jgi:hypothetical protein